MGTDTRFGFTRDKVCLRHVHMGQYSSAPSPSGSDVRCRTADRAHVGQPQGRAAWGGGQSWGPASREAAGTHPGSWASTQEHRTSLAFPRDLVAGQVLQQLRVDDGTALPSGGNGLSRKQITNEQQNQAPGLAGAPGPPVAEAGPGTSCLSSALSLPPLPARPDAPRTSQLGLLLQGGRARGCR